MYYDWPVGYQPGDKLSDFWQLEEHKLGEETFTHFADGTAHKNRMQGNDFVQSQMYKKGVTCWSCHDVHGTPNDALLIKPVDSLCQTCHGPNTPAGPSGSTLEHTHHSVGNVKCVDCHMPKIERTIADVNVRSHTFNFIPPSHTDTVQDAEPVHDVSHEHEDRGRRSHADELAERVGVASGAVTRARSLTRASTVLGLLSGGARRTRAL